MNPVDDREFTKPVIKSLRGHVDAFTHDLANQRGNDRSSEYQRLQEARPCAVAWVYLTVLVAWAQDHGLVDTWLRSEGEKTRALMDADPADWLAISFASLGVHPATECLLDPRYSELAEGTPGDEVCEALLSWWANEAPPLAYDVDRGPGSLSGWLPGDLLQALSDERLKRFAFAQTPWWVADFIIDLTLVPAADEFRDITLRTIDPCCGTGHFLIRKIEYLWELYTTGQVTPRSGKDGEPVGGWTHVGPADAIKRIIAGVHGCEKDPLIAAVARLRFVVAIGDLMHRSGLIDGPLRLDHIPPFRPVIAVCDSLLAGVISKSEYAKLHPKLAAIENLGIPDEREQLDLPGEVAAP